MSREEITQIVLAISPVVMRLAEAALTGSEPSEHDLEVARTLRDLSLKRLAETTRPE